jgi:hypothetical protein
MNENTEEIMLDLLCKQAVYGLNEEETKQLSQLEKGFGGLDAESIEATAAMIALVGVDAKAEMPTHLQARILDSADDYFHSLAVSRNDGAAGRAIVETATPRRSFVDWLGWAVAAAACVALGVNIYLTRSQPAVDTARQGVPTPTATVELTPAQKRQQLMESAPDVIRAEVAGMKEYQHVGGDIVWSDSEQTGYMRFRNLPVNDKSKETYQLWIFDETQEEKTPIDGGTFDVDQNGEVVIPINARLKAKNPKAFAVTVEKPGGVVVSKRERIAAIGKTSA